MNTVIEIHYATFTIYIDVYKISAKKKKQNKTTVYFVFVHEARKAKPENETLFSLTMFSFQSE